MKILKSIVVFAVLTGLVACASTPTQRSFKEGWKDSVIGSKVKWRLGRDKMVKAGDINVDTWRGQVTLTGRVTTDAEKAQAEQVARGVKKVIDVRNYIDVVGGAAVAEKKTFSKPKGIYGKPQEIAVKAEAAKPEIAKSETVKQPEEEPLAITEEDLTKEITREPVMLPEAKDGVSDKIEKDLADITLQAEQELKELRAKKKQ